MAAVTLPTHYRNVFAELGYAQAEIDARIENPRFPHLFGGSFGISVSDRKQQACAAAVQICGAFCFPYTAGGCILQKNYRFPDAEWMAYSFIV